MIDREVIEIERHLRSLPPERKAEAKKLSFLTQKVRELSDDVADAKQKGEDAELRALRSMERFKIERDDLIKATIGLLACIETSARDDGPKITKGGAMARVCKVLTKTGQFDIAKKLVLPYVDTANLGKG